jgi:hypothetical protein
MTAFVSIRIDADMILDPSLKPLIDKLTLINPKWVFSSNKKTSEYEVMIDHGRYNPTAEHRAPEGFSYIRAVDVSEDGEKLGLIGVDTHYRSNTDQRFVYYVNSWRINKSRGNQNTTSSLKIETITRECKKLFKPKNRLEVYEKGVEELQNKFNRAHRELVTPIQHANFIKSVASVQLLAYSLLHNIPIIDREIVDTRDALMSDKYKKAVEDYDVAYSISSSTRYPVVEVGGMFMYAGATEVECKTYEELSQSQQEKIAVLQLMQDNEMVRDVGFRASAGKYYLTQ